MPVRKEEAHRALELLEQYHEKLRPLEDKPLREAIERVIAIFKSRLFQALLDIYEFYEETLLNESKTLAQKAFETNRMADNWEINPPMFGGGGIGGIGGGIGGGGVSGGGIIQEKHQYSKTESSMSASTTKLRTTSGGGGGGTTTIENNGRGEPQPRPSYAVGSVRSAGPGPGAGAGASGGQQSAPRTPVFERMSPYSPSYPAANGGGGRGDDYHHHRGKVVGAGAGGPPASVDKWEYEDIVLEKGTSGLGFSIAGGNDNPHVDGDPAIFVTKIIAGGAAAFDGRLKRGDAILRVNTTDLVDVPHSTAVDALKRAGNVVKLYVKRPRDGGGSLDRDGGATPLAAAGHHRVERIELSKGNKGLGFSIAGGQGNEHIPGDAAIYVTKIIDGGAAQVDGRMQVGDKLLAVGNQSLDNVTHETAVAALKATSDRVVLLVAKTPHSVPAPASAGLGAGGGGSINNESFGTTDGGGGSVGGGGGYRVSESKSYQFMDQSPTRPRQGGGAFYGGQGSRPPTAAPPMRYQDEPAGAMPPPPPPSASYAAHSPPAVPRPNEIPIGPRTVILTKSHTGLGFNIVGGEDGEGIYISYLLPGGVADVSGVLFKGDQLLEVNGADLRGATHEQAASALKHSSQHVTITAQYSPQAYAQFEAKLSELREEMISTQGQQQHHILPQHPSPRRELFVRALFDYDPTKDSGLPSRGLAFNYGDILHVTNASDDEWWQAKKVLPDGTEEGYGIIPSKKRVEKKERARRKKVDFGSTRQPSISEKHSGSKKSLTLSRKFPFMKSKERVNEESDAERQDEVILSYEAVEQRRLDYARPVVILGALKDRINDDLISEFPNRYGSCVPHTSRPRRENEVDGKDYYFISREQMDRDISNHLFIEAGQYKGNLYGTSIASVRSVADQGKHCILDVSGNAIKRLQAAGLYPIALFIKPYNAAQLFEWNRRLSDEEAEQYYQRMLQNEQDFAEHFTAIIQGDTPEDIYAKVKEVIRDQSSPSVWVPSPDRL